jgi:phosphoribosylformylglycinamidine (FGAM) synthase PurS component
LGFDRIAELSAGRIFHFVVDADDPGEARSVAEDLSHRLLANPVIQRADVTVSPIEVSA